eukprot:1465761-Rhodomonas_salina.1
MSDIGMSVRAPQQGSVHELSRHDGSVHALHHMPFSILCSAKGQPEPKLQQPTSTRRTTGRNQKTSNGPHS